MATQYDAIIPGVPGKVPIGIYTSQGFIWNSTEVFSVSRLNTFISLRSYYEWFDVLNNPLTKVIDEYGEKYTGLNFLHYVRPYCGDAECLYTSVGNSFNIGHVS